MPEQLVCQCGRHLQVTEAHAGRTVQCPGCGKSLKVPADLGQSAAAPRSPRRAPVLLGILLLVLAAGAAATWFYFKGRGEDEGAGRPDVDDLALVPADAQAFVNLSLSKLWQTPAIQKAVADRRKKDPQAEGPAESMERDLGLRPEDVERLTLASPEPGRNVSYLIARTHAPYPRKKIVEKLREVHEVRYKEHRYTAGKDAEGRTVLLWPASPRVLVAANNEESMRRCLDVAAAPVPSGPLEPILKLCDGRHHLVGGLNPAGTSKEQVTALPGLEVLALVERGRATLDLGDKAVIEARLEAADPEKAKTLTRGLQSLQSPFSPAGLLLTAASGSNATLGAVVGKLRSEAKISQKDRETVIALTLDSNTVAEKVVDTPRMMRSK